MLNEPYLPNDQSSICPFIPSVVLVFLTQTQKKLLRLNRENEENHHLLSTTQCQVLGCVLPMYT